MVNTKWKGAVSLEKWETLFGKDNKSINEDTAFQSVSVALAVKCVISRGVKNHKRDKAGKRDKLLQIFEYESKTEGVSLDLKEFQTGVCECASFGRPDSSPSGKRLLVDIVGRECHMR
ncbi:hypothetical protein scyTo_0005781 [Scyliorhinus torazame]|uniref:Uncharacterized protein n=1 Tax=Scyliorhinus torazame TaxID=75743 RepID=A0A401PCG7_SCYTO|nr:hypothetical protein [Scyliorhinus torazame]